MMAGVSTTLLVRSHRTTTRSPTAEERLLGPSRHRHRLRHHIHHRTMVTLIPIVISREIRDRSITTVLHRLRHHLLEVLCQCRTTSRIEDYQILLIILKLTVDLTHRVRLVLSPTTIISKHAFDLLQSKIFRLLNHGNHHLCTQDLQNNT